ncbi:acyl-CoA dehydrogenase family protein [Pseudonocardia acaciae]|uniref:acyl-CoA dehydrogenase family protein n=1 Tax=Pseudonocardia acaciae TaxID=551276 RepID=UPI0004918EFB|nr:acyl-CoA dehydrogenase family protein [Pseudonocardia acaciae]
MVTDGAGKTAALRDIAEVIEKIGADAAERDRGRVLPRDELAELLRAGIGALRVPARYGGYGASLPELAEVLVSLAAAESNLSQILRGHLGLVELLRQWPAGDQRDALLASAGRGEFFGPAGAERTSSDLVSLGTTLVEEDGRLFLRGRKYYTTGSLFADWLNVLVRHEGRFQAVVVRRGSPGLEVIDDWDGFGQRLTASGTAVFDRVPVDPGYVFPHDNPEVNDFAEAFYQFVHSATQAGIIRRLADDLAEVVRGRTRSYPLAPTQEPREDPQVLGVVGEVHSRAFSARANVLLLAATLRDAAGRPEVLRRALVESAATQVVNTRLVGEASWLAFDAGSASATRAALGLDRHWRNARTVSSHNPAIYKAALVGRYAVTGTVPGGFLNSPVT